MSTGAPRFRLSQAWPLFASRSNQRKPRNEHIIRQHWPYNTGHEQIMNPSEESAVADFLQVRHRCHRTVNRIVRKSENMLPLPVAAPPKALLSFSPSRFDLRNSDIRGPSEKLRTTREVCRSRDRKEPPWRTQTTWRESQAWGHAGTSYCREIRRWRGSHAGASAAQSNMG